MKERLQKLMAQANVASRRASEELIEQGRVRVNGAVAKLGDKADPDTDTIEVDGVRLKFKGLKKIYIALNKPKNVLSTSLPHRGDERQTVMDLVPFEGHVFTIGRLDADSEGLVVVTNDGDLAQKLTHPSYMHTKTYRVVVQGLPSAQTLAKWRAGIYLDDEEGRTAPCMVDIVKGSERETVLRVIMTEGKKRQIRRVAAQLGHRVVRLTRTHIGLLSVDDLDPGEWRELTAHEVHLLSTPAPEFKTFLRELRKTRALKRAEDQRTRKPRRDDTEPRRRRALVDFIEGEEADAPRPRRPAHASRSRDTAEDRPPHRPRFERSREGTAEDRPRRSRPPFKREGAEDSRPPRRPRGEHSENTSAEERPRRSRPPFKREGDDDSRSSRRPYGNRKQGTDSTRGSSERRSPRPAGRERASGGPRGPHRDQPQRPTSSNRPAGGARRRKDEDQG